MYIEKLNNDKFINKLYKKTIKIMDKNYFYDEDNLKNVG